MSDDAPRNVVVTGAAGGLGRAFALAFGAKGYRVLAADINEAGAAETARLITEKGGTSLAAGVDVTDRDSTGQLARTAHGQWGPVDVLINNAALYAGISRLPLEQIESAEWDRVMAVNVKGPWLCTAAFSPVLREPGASVINIASTTALFGPPLWVHYVASKGAVIALTRSTARELGPRGITVNAIAPGFTLTEASYDLMADAETYGIERGAIQRASRPEDIVGAALFLADGSSEFITGQTLVVDGGKHML